MKRILALLGLLTLLLPQIAVGDNATVAQDVLDLPVMYLATGISSTQVNSIQLGAPYRNGSALIIPALSGAILQLSQNGKVENVYASLSVNQTSGLITLTGVTRDLCYNTTKSFAGCSTGQLFSKGAEVRLVNDARYFNLKANTDRPNVFSASGSIAFIGSGSLIQPYFSTTAIRDRQLGTNPKKGSVSCTDDTSQCYDFLAGAWRSRSGSNVINASTTIGGKVTLGAIADQIAKTAGAVVVQTQHLTQSGSQHVWNNSYQAGRIPILNSSGALAASLGGLGIGNVSSGSVLIGQGSGAVKFVAPSTNKNVLQSDGRNWNSVKASVTTVYVSGTNSATVTNPQTDTAFDTHTYAIPASDLIQGVAYEWECGVTFTLTSSNLQIGVELGSTVIARVNAGAEASTNTALFRGTITGTAAAGASVSVKATASFTPSDSSSLARSYGAYGAANTATNGGLTLQFFSKNGANNGAQNVTLNMCSIKRISSN